ncbi:MAG TPA: SUF system NifU family Fe-S cluster assembly protein [Thermoanaerobaculia bacterium]|nr:SUF system NifU family Fe-S cluster assembly protein [Thermoanaerobaculia bacterium]
MSTDLSDLYQEVILDHNRRPRNFGPLPAANRSARGHNPLCGDKVTLFVRVEDDRVEEIAFEGSGCAISMAAASLMTEALKGVPVAEARTLFEGFHRLVTSRPGEPVEVPAELGKLAVFAGVRDYPVRVKCATLPWHTFNAALAGAPERPVSTE